MIGTSHIRTNLQGNPFPTNIKCRRSARCYTSGSIVKKGLMAHFN